MCATTRSTQDTRAALQWIYGTHDIWMEFHHSNALWRWLCDWATLPLTRHGCGSPLNLGVTVLFFMFGCFTQEKHLPCSVLMNVQFITHSASTSTIWKESSVGFTAGQLQLLSYMPSTVKPWWGPQKRRKAASLAGQSASGSLAAARTIFNVSSEGNRWDGTTPSDLCRT